jgi:hypothetical protein
MRRSRAQIQADAHTVRRERVLRWLTYQWSRCMNGSGMTDSERLARARLLAEMVDDFANGRGV